MIFIKSKSELELMKRAGRNSSYSAQIVEEAVKPGVTTKELDSIAEKYVLSRNAMPLFKGVRCAIEGGIGFSRNHMYVCQ